MATHRFSLLTLPLAAASLALGACGGGDSGTESAGDQQAKFREAALDFAKCMREHGVDMPDPQPGGGGGIQLALRADEANRATLDRAQKACQKHLDKVPPPEISEEDRAKFREQALKFARCMREQGIDMPDPTFSGDGAVRQRMTGSGPEDPRFERASEKCSKYQPRGGPRLEARP
jgi:hypothetical protein